MSVSVSLFTERFLAKRLLNVFWLLLIAFVLGALLAILGP